MDFKTVLRHLTASFDERGVRYALIGGLALSIWGVPRGTVDIDFLVNREDLPKVYEIMNALGYELRHSSENVSQFVSPLKIFGEVDFIHAFRTPSLIMLQRAVSMPIFSGLMQIRVIKVEDLIAFKLQAMKNDQSREPLDLADIEMLLSLRSGELDWKALREYFSLFGYDGLFEQLRGKFCAD